MIPQLARISSRRLQTRIRHHAPEDEMRDLALVQLEV